MRCDSTTRLAEHGPPTSSSKKLRTMPSLVLVCSKPSARASGRSWRGTRRNEGSCDATVMVDTVRPSHCAAAGRGAAAIKTRSTDTVKRTRKG